MREETALWALWKAGVIGPEGRLPLEQTSTGWEGLTKEGHKLVVTWAAGRQIAVWVRPGGDGPRRPDDECRSVGAPNNIAVLKSLTEWYDKVLSGATKGAGGSWYANGERRPLDRFSSLSLSRMQAFEIIAVLDAVGEL
jgi:hypothetical protein